MDIHHIDQLNIIPYESKAPDEDQYESYISTHSISNIFLTYIFILIFLLSSIFTIYYIIVSYSESNTIILEQNHEEKANQIISFNFTKIPMKYARVKIEMKFYSSTPIKSDELLFITSTSQNKKFYSYSTINSMENENDIPNNNYIYSLTILNEEISSIDFISIQSNYHSLLNFSQIICSLKLSFHHFHYLSYFSHNEISFILFLFFIMKGYRIISLKSFQLSKIVSVVFIVFCISTYFPFEIFGDEFLLTQSILEICLITLFYEISFSFIYLTYDFLPLRVCETIFDFFISCLNMFYSLGIQIYNTAPIHFNPRIIYCFLLVLFVLRYLQKGYYWKIIGTNHSNQCSIVYTFLNIVTTFILFSADIGISNQNTSIRSFSRMLALTSYAIMLSIINTPTIK